MNMQEILNILALTRINYFHLAGLRQLYDELGSATAVIENRHHLQDVLPDASPRLAEGLRGIDDAMKRAETELEYDMKTTSCRSLSTTVTTRNDSKNATTHRSYSFIKGMRRSTPSVSSVSWAPENAQPMVKTSSSGLSKISDNSVRKC